ncbi:MAG: DUF115 domain-containing protein, partial [Anaeroplasmataceae bacterium]|nr:DUF115 domain-containing protein [Anaeroplasmataceae bacterium]
SHKIYNESEEDKQQDLWFTKYGYDWHISDLQMTCIESEFPGNREQLLALKNTHVGECCFVIGNGPSLRAEDLEELKRRNIFCFASKRINKIFDKTTWRPDIWGASDLDYIKSCQDEISEITGFTKLICAPAFVKEGIRINDAIYYPFIQMERRPPWFNLDIMRGVHFWGTITCKLINFAAYMGFKKIYLLGVDNSYALKKDNTGKIIIDTSQKSYFAEDYMWQNEEANSNVIDTIKALDYVTESYKSLKWHCDQIGVEVVNATRGGALEAYPREDFDEILAQWETTNNEM